VRIKNNHKFFIFILFVFLIFTSEVKAYKPLYLPCDVFGIVINKATERDTQSCKGDGEIPGLPATKYSDCQETTLSEISVLVLQSENVNEKGYENISKQMKTYCSNAYPNLKIKKFSSTDLYKFKSFSKFNIVHLRSSPISIVESVEKSSGLVILRYFVYIILATFLIILLFFWIFRKNRNITKTFKKFNKK
jgi:hypothetical protein